jgi:hypothetical protein
MSFFLNLLATFSAFPHRPTSLQASNRAYAICFIFVFGISQDSVPCLTCSYILHYFFTWGLLFLLGVHTSQFIYDYRAWHPRSQSPSYLPPWEPETSPLWGGYSSPSPIDLNNLLPCPTHSYMLTDFIVHNVLNVLMMEPVSTPEMSVSTRLNGATSQNTVVHMDTWFINYLAKPYWACLSQIKTVCS